MTIKEHLQQAKAHIEADKQTAINQEKDRVTREQIIPHNQQMDKARDEAIAEITTECNAKIKALQETLAEDKQSLIQRGEDEKRNFAAACIEAATVNVSAKYDAAIGKLTEQIENTEV